MKIEKINDNQIRCTLTREDLDNRRIKLSELAYGTDKAKTLFREMMRQANFEFGFEAENTPLMIEAIPVSAESIVLVITKVDDPEELDTRFARFAPSITEESSRASGEENIPTEVLDLFKKLKDSAPPREAGAKAVGNTLRKDTRRLSRVFAFRTLPGVMQVCSLLAPNFTGESVLFKDASANQYLLLVQGDPETPELFDKTCNILSEYGSVQRSLSANVDYLKEQFEIIVATDAVHALGR